MGANLSILMGETDVVIGIKDLNVVKQMQENHGGWNSGMDECLIGPCKLIHGMGTDALVKAPSGNIYRLNAGLLVKYNAAEEYETGTIVEIIKDEELFKQLQNIHGRWTENMKDILGKKVEIIQKFQDGDYKVKYINNCFTINSNCIVNENDDATKLIEKNQEDTSKLFSTGDSVRVIKNKDKVKRLQKGHGEWVDSMKLLLGKKGKVKSLFADGDLRVKIMGQKVTLNPQCVEKTDSDSESEPDFMKLFRNMAVNISDKSEKGIPKRLNNQTTKFFLAVKSGDLTEVLNLIDLVGANTHDNKKYPLMIAASEGYEDIAKLLIDKQAEINVMNNNGDTALHIAVQKNRFNICRLLVNVGADVNAQNNKKRTPIMVAAVLGSQDILKLLVSSNNADLSIGDSKNNTSLHLAIKSSRENSVETLVDAGADIKATNNKQFSAYHLAALRGHERILEMFLKKEGASIVDLQKEDKFAAIHLVALNNHLGCLRILIKYNADVNIPNSKLQTALHVAVSRKDLECVKILVENKADLNLKDESGDTPLHDGIRIQNIERIKKMSNSFDMFGMLDLLQKSRRGSDNPEDIIMYLVENGAKLDIKNNAGTTPLSSCEDDVLKVKLLSTQDRLIMLSK